MASISGFTDLQVIQKGTEQLLYRARRASDNQAVLLKTASNGNAPVNQRLLHEHNLLQKLKGPSLPGAVDKISDGSKQILVMDDFDGIWLSEAIKTARFDIPTFLRLGLKLAEAIDAIHSAQVIHNAINPSNILVNMAKGLVCVLNFENASLLSVEQPRLFSSSHLDSALPYISPEQTGRMNRSVDYRSDYYALGAVLYEILTGRPPFESPDPLEMVHSHIARIPPTPAQINGRIPKMISDIVMKLLAKNAEDRYQSMKGLSADLQECLLQWSKKEAIEPFAAGTQDEYEVFRLPQKLYGREKEIELLQTVFADVVKSKSRFVSISGYSGIGKTALVNEIYKPLTRHRGYFTSGKFDQLNRDTPYFSIFEALRKLMKQILTERENRLNEWKQRFRRMLGANAAVIIDVIPELEYVIGQQPDMQSLPVQESRNRFNTVFKQFLEALAGRPEHPLVLFLDDLQWADRASLELIGRILEDSASLNMLLIGAHRDNHVDEHHPLTALFKNLAQKGLAPLKIELTPLSPNHVTALIADALHSAPENVANLAAVVYEKTQGNAFFVRQFLSNLHEKNWLYKPETGGDWKWNRQAVMQQGVTENVVQLMAEKLQSVPDSARRIIMLASCIGNTFDLKTLSLIAGIPLTQVASELWEPLRLGLISPLDDSYKYVFESGGMSGEPQGVDTTVHYRFLHDKVQQAAYSMLDDNEKTEVHGKIGKQLLQGMDEEDISEHVYEIIYHLNKGDLHIEKEDERRKLAALNLKAAEKAKRSAAFEATYQYLQQAAELLGDAWDTAYELCWKVYRELSETEYITGRFDAAEKHFDLVINNTRSNVKKARIYITKVRLYTHINKVEEALNTGRDAARLLDQELPEKATQLRVVREYLLVKAAMLRYSIEELYNLPEMQNEKARAAIDLLSHMATAAYFTGPEMIGLLNLKMMRLVLKYGNPNSASHVYSQYGLLVGAGIGQYAEAFKLGELAVKIADEKNLPYWKGKTYLAMGAIINHWRRPMAENLPILKEAHDSAMESGDLLYVLYANGFTIHTKVSMGVQLPGLLEEIEQKLDYSQKVRHTSLDLLSYHKMISEWTGSGQQETYEYDDKSLLAEIREARDTAAEVQFHICRIKSTYFEGDYEGAREYATEAEAIQFGAFGQLMELEYRFYTALVLIELWGRGSKKKHRVLKTHLNKLKTWAQNCPENFMAHYLLARNEYARVSNNRRFNIKTYDESIRFALAQKCYPVAAIACERACAYYQSNNQTRAAFIYLMDALRFLDLWGAGIIKARWKKNYSSLWDMTPAYLSALSESQSTDLERDTISSTIDVNTILKAAQTLSGEIRLERVLENIMGIVLSSAGAERAIFLVLEGDELVLKAHSRASDDSIETLQNQPLALYDDLAKSVVRYVQNSGESVILSNAAEEGEYVSDNYISDKKIKSLLAMPVHYKGKLKAVLYLENNLTTHAFSPQRIEMLRLLSNEMAISLENALLYEELQLANTQLAEYSKSLEEKVKERTEDLQKRSEDLAETNSRLEQTLSRLRQTQEQLIQSEKLVSLGQLTAGIAHELKNPLNFVANFSEVSGEYIKEMEELLASEKGLSSENREEIDDLIEMLSTNMQKISEHSRRADGIIRSMMMHARGSSGQKEETDVNRLVQESMNLVYHGMRAQIAEFNVDLQQEFDESLPPIQAISQDLSRVFLNIINNACYAAWENHKEDGKAQVKIKTLVIDSAINIEVFDNGSGISKEMRDKIFTPFHTSKPTGAGTGLGLSISYDIIKAHGGEITFESTENVSTTFTISLPLSKNDGAEK